MLYNVTGFIPYASGPLPAIIIYAVRSLRLRTTYVLPGLPRLPTQSQYSKYHQLTRHNLTHWNNDNLLPFVQQCLPLPGFEVYKISFVSVNIFAKTFFRVIIICPNLVIFIFTVPAGIILTLMQHP